MNPCTLAKISGHTCIHICAKEPLQHMLSALYMFIFGSLEGFKGFFLGMDFASLSGSGCVQQRI